MTEREMRKFGTPTGSTDAILKKQPESSTPPVWDRLGMERRLMGNQGLLGMVCDAFLADLPEQVEKLAGFLSDGDGSGCERQAHTIKGASANVGGERLKALAGQLEELAGTGELGAVARLMDSLLEESNKLREVIANRNN